MPLFVPLSFGTVVWAGRALVNRANISPGVLILGGALFAAAIDLVIDPMTLRGGTWFLRFNSDWNGYSSDFGNAPSLDISATGDGRDGLGFHGSIAVGPYSVVVLSQ